MLAARGLRFAFMGGLAMNAWTVPAPTYDIDLCLELGGEAIVELMRALEAEGFLLPPTAWLETVGSAQFREFSVAWPFQDGLIPAEFYLALQPFQKETLSRSPLVELDDGFRTHILTAEDLLIYKLIAWRKKDQAAIQQLLAVERTLDWARVRRWAEAYQVSDRLEEAVRDAGQGS